MRRWLLYFLAGLAVVLLVVAALPWWADPVLRMVGRRYHAEFSQYERIGYARFALHDVRVDVGRVTVEVKRIETATPALWLIRHLTASPASIVVADWRVEVGAQPPQRPSGSSSGGGALRTRAVLFKVAAGLERWAPRTEVGRGEVTWPGGALNLESAVWRDRTLQARHVEYRIPAMDITAKFAAANTLTVHARTAKNLGEVSFTSVADNIVGKVSVWDQPAAVRMQLPSQGWLPTSLELVVENWTLDPAQLNLAGPYSALRGNGRLTWKDRHLDVALDVVGESSSGGTALPITAKVHAAGDRNQVLIDAFSVQIPGATARLSAPVSVDFTRRRVSGSSRFTLEADLAQQPWIHDTRGTITGQADIGAAGVDVVPAVNLALVARDVAIGDWKVTRLSTGMVVEWPRMRVNELVLDSAADGKFTASGTYDFRSREVIAAVASGRIHSSLVARFLPGGVQFGQLDLDVKAHGPIRNVQHEGRVRVTDARLPQILPLTLTGTWTGVGLTAEFSEIRAEKSTSFFTVSGRIEQTGARITAMNFAPEGISRLHLVHPVPVRWSPQFEIASLELSGDDAALELAAVSGRAGNIRAAVRNFPSTWIAAFAPLRGPPWKVLSAATSGRWDNGPATFEITSEVEAMLANRRTARLSLSAKGGDEGIKIDELRASEGTNAIVRASGELPVTLHPATDHLLRIERDAPLNLQAETMANPAFWKALSDSIGLELQDPQLRAELGGTWSRPRGELTATLARVAADPARFKFPLPNLDALEIRATADASSVVLERLTARVDGQPVSVSGKLEITSRAWPELREHPLAVLRRDGSWRVDVPDAAVAAFAKYFPAYLAPAGRFSFTAAMKPGGEMDGRLRLTNAVTRPLGPLGVLQSIQADLRLSGRTVHIEKVTASAGGVPVTLSGEVEVPPDRAPRYNVGLKGENLPLARATGLLLRADLDLRLATAASGETSVTGAVRLRESMFLSDVRALIPSGGTADPLRRPPFFAIPIAPFNSWRLGVEVRGDEFLRLRSTIFAGVASAHFRLGGTLGAPRAVGEAQIDTGQVLLPFATFRVDQGVVRLTEADPYSLRVLLTGSSRRFGYDLKMEVKGTAADPVVTFTSSPPLESRQVLLMITAGEVPHDTFSYGTTQRVARLGTYLGQSLINNFGGDATEADRLSITTGERVSRQGRETYNVEYNLNDRFTLVGEYDEFDDYNAGVKWRIIKPKAHGERSGFRTPASPEKTDAPSP